MTADNKRLSFGLIGFFFQRLMPRIACIFFISLLSACGDDDFTDLNQYIAAVKLKPKGPINPLPELKIIEPYVFKPEDLRDPFKPVKQPEGQDENAGDGAAGTGIKPDPNRRKEELEQYPLQDLKMIGTIIMKSNIWALIKASDDTVYRARSGNYMGQNHGKISRVTVDKIDLVEIVPDKKPGTWHEQQATVELQAGAEKK